MSPTKLLTLALGAALLASLSACTAADPDGTGSAKSTSSATATSTQQPVPAHTKIASEDEILHPGTITEAKCTDGKAVISDNSAEVSLKAECASVTVAAGNTIVHLGKVGHLTVDGNINRVEVASAEQITVTKQSKKNDVLYGGSKPVLHDAGFQTVFSATK